MRWSELSTSTKLDCLNYSPNLFLYFPFMFKYAGKCLRKWKRVIHVIFHIFPPEDQRKSPCGCRHWKYACMENGKSRYILVHNISRYVKQGFRVEDDIDEECFLHAHHSIKHQENVTEKKEWLWNKFINLFR